MFGITIEHLREFVGHLGSAVMSRGLKGLLSEVPFGGFVAEIGGEVIENYKRANGLADRRWFDALSRSGVQSLSIIGCPSVNTLVGANLPQGLTSLSLDHGAFHDGDLAEVVKLPHRDVQELRRLFGTCEIVV
jgi:hypothetical protein